MFRKWYLNKTALVLNHYLQGVQETVVARQGGRDDLDIVWEVDRKPRELMRSFRPGQLVQRVQEQHQRFFRWRASIRTGKVISPANVELWKCTLQVIHTQL